MPVSIVYNSEMEAISFDDPVLTSTHRNNRHSSLNATLYKPSSTAHKTSNGNFAEVEVEIESDELFKPEINLKVPFPQSEIIHSRDTRGVRN